MRRSTVTFICADRHTAWFGKAMAGEPSLLGIELVWIKLPPPKPAPRTGIPAITPLPQKSLPAERDANRFDLDARPSTSC